MNGDESRKKDFSPRSETKKKTDKLSILDDDPFKDRVHKGGGIHLTKSYTPKPPKSRHKPAPMACVRDEVGNAVREMVVPPVNLDSTVPKGLRFDDHGMILSHSILGSLDDFRSYLEAKGETELAKRIPKSTGVFPCEVIGRRHSEAVRMGITSDQRNIQSNALQHWDEHMRHRRQQQNVLSDVLDRSVENLLMNQASHFRETQEQRELLNRVMPLIHFGYGTHVGSEFWCLPQRYGDEMSGIRATLTQTEQGRRKAVTFVGQPNSIRQESGLVCSETMRPFSRTWSQSAYLQHQYQEVRDILQDMDIKKPDISGLEVMGSSKPYIPSAKKQPEDKEHKETKRTFEPLYEDVLQVPALRLGGRLASWTGNSSINLGEVGICVTVIFEAQTAERASSHLELHNEGTTAIFYSWQQLSVPSSFPSLHSQTKTPHFYFDSSSSVILPGATQQVEFIFKSKEPGIKTELWQLNTYPLLLQGASMQVTLKGVALCPDKTADQRLLTELETRVLLKMTQSIVDEVLQGVRTPERPSSPAELSKVLTKEQQFLSKNPKLQYLHQPVEGLQSLWQEVSSEHTWDLSVDALRQAVLSLPNEESTQASLTREAGLVRLNHLYLQLSEPFELNHHPLTAAAIGQQLWRKMLDAMASEAVWLRNILGLPERNTWIDEPTISDADLAVNKEVKSGKKDGAAEKSGSRKENKEESNTSTSEKPVQAPARVTTDCLHTHSATSCHALSKHTTAT
ncbi:MYCBP-associated protein [Parambassis ranga]|uniref:MYCBP-associated protein n=1 Tax=Parambassis ranga TaxID=210632 RepID=A0A6P7JVR3_9TELE|nr:MYCBP-associated protein [Parambassis ranga]